MTRYQGHPAVLLGTTMAAGANVTVVGAEVARALHAIERDLPLGVELGKISDQAEVVATSIHEFLEALGLAILIVLAVSLLALGWRAGLVVALTIPLVLAATFLVMSVMGIDLHRISLGALIIALGLLVDDAMIAVEMMERKLEEGSQLDAAILRLPLDGVSDADRNADHGGRLHPGRLRPKPGRRVRELAVLGDRDLARDLMVRRGLFHALAWLQPAEGAAARGRGPSRCLPVASLSADPGRGCACVRWRRTAVALTLGLLAASMASFAYIPQQFFPTSNRPEILVDMWLPEGASFAETEREARRLEQRLAGDPDLSTVTSFIGEGAPRFYLPLDQQLRNQNFAQLMLMAKSTEARERALVRVRAILGRLPQRALQGRPPVQRSSGRLAGAGPRRRTRARRGAGWPPRWPASCATRRR